MNFHAMLEAREEFTNLRDHPEVARQPADFRWLDTS